jgi:hypothetical protein
MEIRSSGNRDAGVKRRAKSAARMADKYLAPQLVAGFVAVPATAKPRQVGVQKLVCRNLHTLRRVASSIRPRLLVEDNDASHSLRESGGGLGMVLSLAKHVPRPSHKPRAVLAAGQPVMGECLLPQARVYPRFCRDKPVSSRAR